MGVTTKVNSRELHKNNFKAKEKEVVCPQPITQVEQETVYAIENFSE